jgi:tryptophan synthase alpha chain
MTGFSQTLDILKKYNAPPPVAGFGISTPDHVKTVLSIGAEGAISGSATVKIMEKFLDNRDKMDSALAAFVKSMKAAALNN